MLLAVIIIELVAIIVLSVIYKLDYFHKITLKRINAEIERQDDEHENDLIKLGVTEEALINEEKKD